MKIKNLAKMTVAAFSLLASVTLAKAGDIYSIDLIESPLYGGVKPTKANPLLAGQKAVIRMRLVNRDWLTTGKAWRFEPNLTSWASLTPEQIANLPMFAPKLGFVFGGDPVYATYVGTESVDSPANVFTDVYFEYTVKSGDLALPALLMGSDRKAVTPATVNPVYFIDNVSSTDPIWKLTNSDSDIATLSFVTDTELAELYEEEGESNCNTAENGMPNGPTRSSDGTGMDYYVKTVDLDENYSDADNGIWRSVGYNETDTANGVMPSVTVSGGSATAAITVYVWVDDGTVAVPYGSAVYDYDDKTFSGSRKILPVTIGAGSSSQTFQLKGLDLGKTAKVCMSSSRDRIPIGTSGYVTNWVSRTINVVQLEPSVTLTLRDLNGDATSELQCSDNYKEYIATLDVKLSTTPTGNIDVDISDDQAVLGQNIVLSTSSDKALNPWESPVTKVSFSAGDANLTKTLFVYALGSTDQIENTAATFTPSSTSAAKDQFTKWNSCKMTLKRASVTVKPQDSQSTIDDMELSSDYDLTLVVSGSYNDLRNVGGDWTVKYYFKDATGKILGGKTIKNPYTATAPATVTGGDLTGKLLLTIPSDHISADATSLELWVVSPSGSESSHVSIAIPDGPSRGMEAFVVDADTEENLYEIEANEGDVKTFKFKLSEKYNNVAYAFLKPQDDSITNSISCSFYAYDGYKGVTIDSDKGISRVAKMTMLDGEAIGRFEVVICSSEEYDADKKLDYNSGAVLTVAAANVEPVVREVKYGSTSVASGGQLSVALPLNIDSTFRATIDEPGKGDLATFETQWYFDDDPYGGDAGDGWYSVVGDPSKTNMTHKFSSSGTWSVKVRCRDKDMVDEGQWSNEFTFTVSVDDEPAVIITPRTGGYTYYEDQTGLAESAFDVSLIGAPVISAGNGPLKVRLTVQNLGASGLVELSTNLVTFTTRQDGRTGNDALSHSFYFKALNGTIDSGNEGFAITATVENPEVDTLGRKWNPTTMNVFILNRPPVLNKPEERNDSEGKPLVTTTHIGETITIPWAVNDVLADKTNLTVTATTDEGKTWTTNTFTAGTSGQFEVKFDEAGASKTITITVTDPELDSNSATLYYTIAASKVLNIAATGPSSGDASIALSSRYARAKGLGAGRVFVSKSDATFARAEDFNLFWNCGMKTTVYAYGYGYQPDDTDDGNLVGDLDIPLDEDGNTYDTGDAYYTYNPADKCGSYFYGWLKAKEAGGKDYELTPSPEIRSVKNGKEKSTSTRGSIDLPQDKTEDEQGYAQTYAEAVFAKEYKESDNMGDINADGVPDYFAIFDYANGRLAAPDGQGAELAAVNALNNDEDYLPGNAQLTGANFIPGETSGWSTRGAPFTARMEIRGFGGADEGEELNSTVYGGLNYGMFKFGAELETGWVSDLDLTQNEKISLLNHLFARRDAILNRRYTQRPGVNKFDGGDWVVVTNLLSTLIRSDTSYLENGSGARKAYIPGFNDSGENAIDGWNEGSGLGHKILVPVTNVVAAVIGQEGQYPAITNVTTNVCWVSESYTTAGHVPRSITNTVEVVTNIYTIGTTVTTNLFWRTPYDSITIADVNVGEWLNRKASKTEYDIAQKAAKEYIDHIWSHYLNRDTSEWGWTCENRTDPTLDDTDGDGFSDGYEYYIWYSAVVGFNGNTLSGYRLDVTDRDSRGIPITSGEIARLYNPNVEGSIKRDTDGDGIADYEEMVLGTNPFHWDTDGDGLSDGYELTYNMDPLSASGEHGCNMNTDGDFMAFVDVADNNEREEFKNLLQYKYIYTATNGTTWAFSTNLTDQIRYISQLYPTTNAFELAGVKAFKVGKYGVTKYTDKSGVTKYYDDYYIPATEKLDKLLEFLDPNATGYQLDSAWTNAATFVINPQIAPVTLRVVKRNSGDPEPPAVAMGLFHHQVHSAFGFDPRTGWYSGGNGLSKTSRWKNNAGSVVPGGAPQNTVAYTAKYEYTLPKYFQIVNSNVKAWTPTNPGVPYEATSETEEGEIKHYMTQHGADTDADGVPDGWELYIGVDPGLAFTSDDESAYNSIRDIDKADGLTLVYEFAGTDSCGVYSECESIYKYHPSQDTGTMKNWYNKFFPTDPRESDSDGDTIEDGAEGKNWKDTLVINRIPQTDDASVLINYFSIYGSPADDGTTSIRGGGYNPCTIDTDSDGLPDPWERQFTGVLFNGTTISDTEGMSVFGASGGKIDEQVRKDIKTALAAYNIPTNVLAGAEFYHILMGMDGTVSDAATSTVLGASDLDWDGDGLQNWQEYLVQAMRQFRYDDDKTPLLGRDCPKVTANGETPGSWNGDKGFLKVSYTEPFTDVQLDFIDEELGYHNFAEWAKNTENYLKDLGYFIDPPMAWDHARNTLNQKYMLPPANIRYYTYAKGRSQATDGDDDHAIYTYVLAGKTYEFTNVVSGTVISGYGLVGDKYRKLTPKMVENSALAMVSDVVSPRKYFTTDPRCWDTDADGMDDYYELFHGLNPILGEVTREAGMHGTYSRNRDIIARATDGKVSPGNNAWIGWANEEAPVYDPIRYPWLMGAGECDADSDGLRNFDESLLANVTSPNAMHTDPTPLWMTDASVKTRSSKIIITTTTPVEIDIGGGIFVPVWDYDPKTGEEFQVYETTTVDTDEKVDLVDTPSYTALFYTNELKDKGVNSSSAMASLPYGGWKLSGSAYAFSFEQNEGYDTDNDWRSDSAELQNSAEPTSDPLNFADPQRRQSVWFGGPEDQGMLVSREESERKTGGADLFKQFTVEAWVRPENPVSGKEQYIVSRAVYCNASSVINTNAQVRLDFALGLDANGCAFGELMNSVDISYRQTGDALPQNEWTHLAATFDGYNFTLYMNGKPVDSGITTLIPANGTKTILQNPHFTRMEGGSYSQDPSIMAIGARPVGETVFNIANVSSSTGWSDIATDFFKGSVDEVRCWDGARTADEIKGDYRTRYTPERVKENRLAVYNAYVAGGSRNDTNGRKILPPELIHHYNFSTLAGAHEADYVQQVPAGFGSRLLASVCRPDDGTPMDGNLLKIGWWSGVVGNADIGSKVYTSPHVVPWVEDTVAHLPKLCGNVADSVFWSENFAGYVAAEDNGLSTYSFPNAMNPYNVVETLNEYSYLRSKLAKVSNTTNETENAYPETSLIKEGSTFGRFYYDNRRGFSGNSDLIPLGSAFAKRLTDYWDGLGAEDAWSRTTDGTDLEGDLDGNAIPAWARLAGYTTPEGYWSALFDGLLPDGVLHPEFAAHGNNIDANHNGIPDWWERYFEIVDCDANGDFDNDGLSNYQEYLISFGDYSVTEKQSIKLSQGVCANKGMRLLNPCNAHSPDENGVSASVVDYFLKPDFSVVADPRITANSYYGEMVGDHDFMETWWEHYYNPNEANAYVYDAHLDVDGDGWSNWAENRARFNENTWVVTGINTNSVILTFEVGDPAWGVWLATNRNTIASIDWYTDDDGWFQAQVYDEGWGGLRSVSVSYTSPILKYRYTIIEETPILAYGGEPLPNLSVKVYGVDVADTNGVRLAAYSKSTLDKPDATFVVTAKPVNGIVEAVIAGKGLKEGLNTFIATTADGKIGVARNVDVGFDSAKVELSLAKSDLYFSVAASTNNTSLGTVEILRTAVNGSALEVPRRVYVKQLDLSAGAKFTEAEIVSPSAPDLDWKLLASDMADRGEANVQNVEYSIYVNGEAKDSFVRRFNKTRAIASVVAPVDDAPVYSASPTFRFTATDSTVSAYRLQVADANGDLVWDSNAVGLPCAQPYTIENTSVWAVTPGLYADCFATTNGSPVFADGAAYKWRVALLNAKFPTVDADDQWSSWATFQMDVANRNQNPDTQTGYGNASVAVRYYGAGGVTDLSGVSNIVVEAYTTTDFTASPVGRILVDDLANLDNPDDVTTTNCVLRGLLPGNVYLLAYIDSNCNGKRDKWESWGYANGVDDCVQDIYTPKAVAVTDERDVYPRATIYIEDCDRNQNEIPDILEGVAAETPFGDSDKDGVGDSDESDTYGTNPDTWDTDGDGMPDGWETVFADTNPTLEDGDGFVSYGDVMAYAEETWKLVTDQNGFVYLVDPANDAVAVGDDLPLSRLISTYDYAGKRGVGTNLLDTATTIRVAKVEPVTVALVHAQVYDRFGFNPLTAVPAEGAVNTKPFTALDKYLVIRYLEAMGFCSEENVNVTGAWAQYSLVPSDRDNDRDGVADGWELYTMFGPGGSASVASLAEVKVSPWNYNDARSTSPSKEYESFRLIDEYDGGVLPTDPWTKDTDGDGIPDNFAFRYHLKGNQFDSDPDRDGLSNYQEYLISEVYYDSLVPSYKLDPDNAHSQSQVVSDYFLQHNKLYYGELFADHDHIDDSWEDAQPVVTTRGGTVLANYSRFVYDANRDVLGHGWDNWALSRAWFDGVYVTNIIAEATNSADGAVMVTTNSVLTSTFVDNGGNPSPRIPLSVTYHGKGGNFFGETTKYQVVVKAWNLDRRADSEVLGKPDKIWSSTITSPAYLEIDGFASGYSSETGSVKPGRNMFVAYVAEGEAEDGVAAPSYVAGMPFGVVTDVEVGPIGCENVNIEMTDTNASMPRIDIVNALKLQDVYAQAAGAGSEDALALYNEVAEKYTDRGRWGAYDQLRKSDYVGLDTRGASTNEIDKVRVRILRSGVNGQFVWNGVNFSSSEPILDTVLPVGVHDVITEADILSACSDADLDWGAVRQMCIDNRLQWIDISNICYRIVLFDGTTDRAIATNDNLCVMFVNQFEDELTPVANMDVRTYSGQPTFSWTHDNTIGKEYPAFQLRVWEVDGTTLVFDSGVQRAPARDAAGRYNWTAPLWVGSITDKDIVFEPNKTYLWSVSMLDAKYIKPIGETKVKFMMQETSPSGGSSDYGIIPVKVKYLGPGEVSTNKHVKCLRVEAFTSPDFIGLPAGAGYVYDDSELGTINGISVNAKIAGLPANRDYYVRAYIDTDGNGVHDAWESWGYACYRGSTVRLDQYEPRAFSPANARQVNDCVVYVEDADTNCNMVPDVLEYQMEGDGKQVSLSPYIAYTASDASKKAAINNAKSGASGNKKTLKSAPKQYAYAVSRAAISNGSVTPGLLAVATGGVSYESSDSTHIKIKSFSLEEGISLEVVVDEDYQVVSYGYDTGTIKVGVEYATTLENGGDWQSAGEPVSISFPLKAGTTEIGAESLDAIKAAIEKIESEVSGAAYFRVKAVPIE